MDMMPLLTWIGTGASLCGAGFSFWQAIRSRSAAKEVQQVRKRFIDHRITSDLAQLRILCKKAIRAMENYGPGSVFSQLAGRAYEHDAMEVQSFLIALREHRTYFTHEDKNQADDFCKIVNAALDNFSNSRSDDSLRSNGSLLLTHLCTMSSLITEHLELKTDI